MLTVALALALPCASAHAQHRRTKGEKPVSKTESERAKSRKDLATATQEYRASLDAVVSSLEPLRKTASARVEKLRDLFKQDLASKSELDKAEAEYAKVESQIAEAKRNMEEADMMYAEATAPLPPLYTPPARGYYASSAVIRGYGAGWSIAEVGKVQSFFAGRFGRALPISAFGQTAVHDRLGFDHHNAVDVGVHPDSPEGQALIAYLRSAGIPFLAFREAVPGKATGAHIHIGLPSHRLFR